MKLGFDDDEVLLWYLMVMAGSFSVTHLLAWWCIWRHDARRDVAPVTAQTIRLKNAAVLGLGVCRGIIMRVQKVQGLPDSCVRIAPKTQCIQGINYLDTFKGDSCVLPPFVCVGLMIRPLVFVFSYSHLCQHAGFPLAVFTHVRSRRKSRGPSKAHCGTHCVYWRRTL